MTFRVKATNDNVKLSDVIFTGVNLDNLSNFVLTDAAGTVFATANTATATAVTFDDIAGAPSIAKDANAVFYVKANVNSNTNGVNVSMTLTSINIKGSNGAEVAATGPSITSNTHTIAENRFAIADATPANKNLSSTAMKFTVAAEGKTEVTLDSLAFATSIFGYTGTAEVRVYKDGSTDLAGSGTVLLGSDTQTVTLTSFNTVAAGTTATYTVKVVTPVGGNVGVDPNSNSHSWSVTLNQVTFDGGYSATDYETVGTTVLPITASLSNG